MECSRTRHSHTSRHGQPRAPTQHWPALHRNMVKPVSVPSQGRSRTHVIHTMGNCCVGDTGRRCWGGKETAGYCTDWEEACSPWTDWRKENVDQVTGKHGAWSPTGRLSYVKETAHRPSHVFLAQCIPGGGEPASKEMSRPLSAQSERSCEKVLLYFHVARSSGSKNIAP